jgi:ketosteroid isomerase-like protein
MRAIILAAHLILSLSPAMFAQHGSNTDAEQTRILALENAWNLAEEHKDVKALDGLLANTMVYIDYDGTFMDKAQFIASVKAPSLHPEQIVNESMTAHVYGDSAVVTGIYREKGVNKGKSYLRRGRFTDTWVNQNGTWVCVASQSTLITH